MDSPVIQPYQEQRDAPAYSDGVLEAQNPAGDEYGMERMLALIGGAEAAAPAAVVESCMRTITAFGGAASFADDVSVLALRRAS